MPAMQYGQRMIKVVSVSVGIGRSCTGATDRGELDEYRAEPAPRCRQACRQAGRYCGNWGTGPVGFLAMRLARFREHACTGGRLRVWPRTKLIGSARSRRDLPGRKESR